MIVQQIVHPSFTSNTYIISNPIEDYVWLVDIGNFEGVMEQIADNKRINGVFLTHYHYDHIYGINKLVNKFPNCQIYASPHTIEGLYSAKMNLSFYHETPIIFEGDKYSFLKENDKLNLFPNICLEVIETPGHNSGCLSFKVGDYLFTGDSYIPDIDVVTKLKGGNKDESKISLEKIKSKITPQTIICPGHFAIRKYGNKME
jgi:hydroxyacylglutathione hydrolase